MCGALYPNEGLFPPDSAYFVQTMTAADAAAAAMPLMHFVQKLLPQTCAAKV